MNPSEKSSDVNCFSENKVNFFQKLSSLHHQIAIWTINQFAVSTFFSRKNLPRDKKNEKNFHCVLFCSFRFIQSKLYHFPKRKPFRVSERVIMENTFDCFIVKLLPLLSPWQCYWGEKRQWNWVFFIALKSCDKKKELKKFLSHRKKILGRCVVASIVAVRKKERNFLERKPKVNEKKFFSEIPWHH